MGTALNARQANRFASPTSIVSHVVAIQVTARILQCKTYTRPPNWRVLAPFYSYASLP